MNIAYTSQSGLYRVYQSTKDHNFYPQYQEFYCGSFGKLESVEEAEKIRSEGRFIVHSTGWSYYPLGYEKGYKKYKSLGPARKFVDMQG
jgi:hypothetical protein